MPATVDCSHEHHSSSCDHDHRKGVLSASSGDALFLRPVTLLQVMSAAWPYLLGGVAVVGSGFLVYHLATKED
jgi:hypothetical protein